MKNKYVSFINDTFSHWQNKQASRMGAAISYYAIFSIAPLLILLMAIVRTIFDRDITNTAVAHTLNIAVGSNLSVVIQGLIASAYRNNTGVVTAVIGGVVLIIAALSVLGELNSDLDDLWTSGPVRLRRESTVRSIKIFLRNRLLALSLILLFGFLLLLVVAFGVFISFFHYTLPLVLQSHLVVQTINSLGTLLGATLLFSIIYRILPDTKLPWRELIWGAFVTAILFLIGKFLISWYIESFGTTSAYGAAGSIVGLLLWVYYSAQVFFIGAAGTFVYSKKYGFLSKKN